MPDERPDDSWTVGPTLLWFVYALIVALPLVDHSLSALADRVTAPRESAGAPPAGPAFAPQVAAADEDVPSAPIPTSAPAASGNHDLGVLDDVCLDGSDDACKRWAMDAFYHAVAAEKAGKLGRALRVSWYGDSVVATDAIPGRLRQRLQTELGDGGPGFVYVEPPHRFCNNDAIVRGSSGTWLTYAISTIPIADHLYGPGGSTTETVDGASSTIKIASGMVHGIELYYLAQPHGGTATISADGAELARVDTAGADKRAGWASASDAAGARKIEIATRGRVRLFGIDLENPTGAVVDNLGVVSVNVKSYGNNDGAHWRAELGHRAADLIMIMIGANEAEWLAPGDRDTKDYQAHYEQVLAPIREGAPNASCLVVSPTDQAEADGTGYRSRPVMPLLVAAQRAAAHARGCAFYSTYDWMGGKSSAAKWFRARLVSSDFQHLSRRGADKMADAVFDTLMLGYRSYAGK
ncbi:MAG TPA: GDSL-type esterase/lipase family protein [Kofleriaceae bacterium]|nr:GDSL-type esterase/lipase family protein [Kofleriaceae bacterium]